MKLRLSLAAFAVATITACQSVPVADGDAALAANGQSEGPEMICRIEPVSGSRVRKQEVCSPAKFNNAAGDSFQQHLNNGLNEPLPPSAGGG